MKTAVVCVNVGTKYPPYYVTRLRDGVARHAPGTPFVCLTDHPAAYTDVASVDISGFQLGGWWAKMVLFVPWVRNAGYDRVVYLDLDTVVCGSLEPLLRYDGDFAVCANFTRLAQKPSPTWPCKYGSCAMSFPANWGGHVWDAFNAARHDWMKKGGARGDQWVIERLHPDAVLLQDVMPSGFFLHWREFEQAPDGPPPGCSLAIFAGNRTPENTDVAWMKREWTRAG